MSGSTEHSANVIREIVGTDGTVAGSRLAALLKQRVPGWNPAEFGVRSLREFVTAHVAGVVVSGRSGMDVIYGVATSPDAPTAVETLGLQPDYWRVWVSPNSERALVVDRQTGTLRTGTRGATVAPGELRIDPPGVGEHRAVALAFASGVSGELRQNLDQALASPDDLWWRVWLRELRRTEDLSAWHAFRRKAFEDKMVACLREGLLNEPVVEAVLRRVRERHASQRPRRSVGPIEHHGGQALRSVVVAAVQRMSDSELRDLRLPVGLVVDAMRTLRPR